MTKIALIGDIHFGRFSRSNEFAVPGEIMQDITDGAASMKNGLVDILKDENVEYIFIAGDLTSTGTPIEHCYCNEAINNISDKSNINRKNVVLSFGNHDVDWNISSIAENIDYTKYSDSGIRNKIENLYQKVSYNVGSLIIDSNDFIEKGPAPFTGIFDRDEFLLFVLNSGWCSSKKNRVSHGKLEQDQLDLREFRGQDTELLPHSGIWFGICCASISAHLPGQCGTVLTCQFDLTKIPLARHSFC